MPNLLRINSVSAKVGLKPSTIWQYVREGKFPKPHKLSARVTVWNENDVTAWTENRLTDSAADVDNARTKRGRFSTVHAAC
jgi:prophage regulatory protein